MHDVNFVMIKTERVDSQKRVSLIHDFTVFVSRHYVHETKGIRFVRTTHFYLQTLR